MKLPTFEIEQNGKKMYLVYEHARELVKSHKKGEIKVDVWTSDNPGGYQRELDLRRAKKFGEFISDQRNISPPSFLFSVRANVKFTLKVKNFGTLEMPDKSILWVVDAQHRIAGLVKAFENDPTLNITFSVIIMCPSLWGARSIEDKRFEEAKQFVIINRTQKRVRADLHDRFLARLPSERRRELAVLAGEAEIERIQKAIGIIDKLNKKPDSPWYKGIKIPGERIGIVGQVSFKTALLDYTLRDPLFERYSDDELVEYLDNWWKAWQDLCPDAFDNPAEYLIQKTTGVYALHELFAKVSTWFHGKGVEWTKTNFRNFLEKMTEGNTDDFWSREGEVGKMGTGRKICSQLARTLWHAFLEGVET